MEVSDLFRMLETVEMLYNMYVLLCSIRTTMFSDQLFLKLR